ncbi:YesL family protein [Planococcus shenhongbingii]|uniref:DUF624 domain-containing protein n=1 Tax=Planococcus shenhongbingii TaxID=3058398 RepID=A0ABT8NEZ8_9BACL|nr:DUF624 domain-containing protein [Planococcus sp. N017]MDN7246478.1 DUF624 domain-containing protein [Planococcus sp. N017]
MRDLPGLTGALYVFAEWIMRFSTANILWIIVNLPLLFVLLSVYINGFGPGFVVYLLPLVLLIPAVTVPSTVALFATAREWILQKDQSSITKTYFFHMKANYRKNFLAGLALLALWLVWLVDIYFFKQSNDFMALLFTLIGLGLFVYTLNFFSLCVHYRMKTRTLLKNAFFITLGNPLLSLFILVSNMSLFYVSATRLYFLIPLFTVSISAYLSFLAFYRFSLKMQKKAESSI